MNLSINLGVFEMKKFYPVIHCIDPFEKQGFGHALFNARIAYENGADGVFLIGHSIQYDTLIKIYENTRKQFPEKWIGINFLDRQVFLLETLKTYSAELQGLNALWVDSSPEQKIPRVEVFGGLAFKYQNPNPSDEDLVSQCETVTKYSTVATTSGDETGKPPLLKKIERIKEKIGEFPLAIASGISEENVTSFLPFVDHFLVATSITERDSDRGNQEYFVPEKVRGLANLIHN